MCNSLVFIIYFYDYLICLLHFHSRSHHTIVPNFNPKDIIANLLRMMDGVDPVEMVPWYKVYLHLLSHTSYYPYSITFHDVGVALGLWVVLLSTYLTRIDNVQLP